MGKKKKKWDFIVWITDVEYRKCPCKAKFQKPEIKRQVSGILSMEMRTPKTVCSLGHANKLVIKNVWTSTVPYGTVHSQEILMYVNFNWISFPVLLGNLWCQWPCFINLDCYLCICCICEFPFCLLLVEKQLTVWGIKPFIQAEFVSVFTCCDQWGVVDLVQQHKHHYQLVVHSMEGKKENINTFAHGIINSASLTGAQWGLCPSE